MTKKYAQGRLEVIKRLIKDTGFREWMEIKFNAEEGARAERTLYGSSQWADLFLKTVGTGLDFVRICTRATEEEMFAAEKLLRLERQGQSTRQEKR